MSKSWPAQYCLNMAMAVDQFLSAVLGGHPDDTISQRLGRAKLSGGGLIVKASCFLVDGLALVLFKDKDHCVSSLEGKTHARELWNWGGNRSMIKVEDLK